MRIEITKKPFWGLYLFFLLLFVVKLGINLLYPESVLESFQYSPIHASMNPVTALQISTAGNAFFSLFAFSQMVKIEIT